MASTFSTLVGLIAVALRQRIDLLQRTIVLTIGAVLLLLGLMVWAFRSMPAEQVDFYSKIVTNTLLLGIVSAFIVAAVRRRVNVYDAFIEGAKDGFKVAIGIVPFLIAVLVAVGMFRASFFVYTTESQIRQISTR